MLTQNEINAFIDQYRWIKTNYGQSFADTYATAIKEFYQEVA